MSSENEESYDWDLFISHASEDKDEIVRPLATALKNAGFKVWYDEFTLTIGDSLRESIDRGLASSRYGLVILSKNFFRKKWSKTELNGLAAREREGKKVILPVWHKIDRDYVLQFSPTLADRLAVSTENGIAKVVEEVLRVVEPSQKRKAKQAMEESTSGRLDHVIEFLRSKDLESIVKTIKETSFEELKQTLLDVLDAIAFFDLQAEEVNLNIFNFVYKSVLERNKEEGSDLFETLLIWYFQTATPASKEAMLEIFSSLTRLSQFKEVVRRKNLASRFVAEFGISRSYDVAGTNTKILKNIEFLLSEADYRKIVEFALSNEQIWGSWKAKDYLLKILTACEGTVDEAKLEMLRNKLV